jgi:hypothetical protein
MSRRAADRGTLLLAILAAGIVAGAFLVSDGLYTIDELIYLMSAEAMRARGSLIVENGWDLIRSPDLQLWFLVDGPNGLAPQYPPGLAAIGAPFAGLFGARGLILVNALAAAATLFLVRALARRLFRDEGAALGAALLFGLGSFWLEYAWGVWPHALGVALATAALLCVLRGLDAGDGGGPGWAAAAGALIGAGMLVRADAVLLLPAAAAAAILWSARPWASLAAGAAGLAPFAVAMAAANARKFGTLNPLSYGADGGGGGASAATYLPLLAAGAAGLALLIALRRLDARASRRLLWAAGAAAALVAALLPAAGRLALDYAEGVRALILDMAAVQDPRLPPEARQGGTLAFWGIYKQALGQSLPWVGLAALLPFCAPGPEGRRAAAFVALAVGIWTAPFLFLSWHGGLGSNMRYFLPVLPLLAAAAAMGWAGLARRSPGSGARPEAIGGVAALAAVLARAMRAARPPDRAHRPRRGGRRAVGRDLLRGHGYRPGPAAPGARRAGGRGGRRAAGAPSDARAGPAFEQPRHPARRADRHRGPADRSDRPGAAARRPCRGPRDMGRGRAGAAGAGRRARIRRHGPHGPLRGRPARDAVRNRAALRSGLETRPPGRIPAAPPPAPLRPASVGRSGGGDRRRGTRNAVSGQAPRVRAETPRPGPFHRRPRGGARPRRGDGRGGDLESRSGGFQVGLRAPRQDLSTRRGAL